MSRISIRLLSLAGVGLMIAIIAGQSSRSTAEDRPIPKEQFHRVPYTYQKKIAYIIKGTFSASNGGTVVIGAAPGHTLVNPWTGLTYKISDSNNLIIYATAGRISKNDFRTGLSGLAGTGQLLVTTTDPVTSTTIDVEEVAVDPCS